MDSALIAAVIGTLGGGLATGGAAWLRTRAHLRTAARLIYAELTRDSAAVAYFRQTGHWAAPTLSRAAWDRHGAALARRRDGRSFETVHRGYEALELVPFIADDTLTPAVREQWLGNESRRIATAIEEIGAIAQVSRKQIQTWTRRLEGGRLADVHALPLATSGVVSLPLLDRLTGDLALELVYTGPGVVLREGSLVILPSVEHVAQYVVFDAEGGTSFEHDRLRVARYSGQPPTGDAAVDEAYDGLTAAATFASEVLGRDSIDGSGGPLVAVVHHDVGYNNAYWTGQYIVLGDGDEEIFGRFTQCPEVVASEVWPGIPEISVISFSGESGALSVSIRDVFASLTKQYARGQAVDEADWVLGAGLLMPSVNGVGLRSLKAPGTAYDDEVLGKDPQPDHMRDYLHTERDNGGVHINGGIPSRAFFLVAAALGGKAWERAGLIWWDALTSGEVGETPLFADWARLTAEAAVARYSGNSEEHRAVLSAWDAVGVPIGRPPAGPQTPDG
ncbi:M4 family metallopeptidase [Streptomyces sp. N50]|uniref:M4 family metallopeptidase n=1 Tax=Streptomyces sp. N50 TaxID=3081765 RepID=UPI0029624F23|nr:M4 family metallopeptidase [Streptomyces sp. N50]WOX16047.1 M4 family metallopeptidase [Streptomyces sp. N50]